MIFDRLVTNAKGPQVELRLTGLDAIVGPNKSRKSAVLQSARAALTGMSPLGNNSGPSLKAFANDGEELHIELTGPAGIAAVSTALNAKGQSRKAALMNHEGPWTTKFCDQSMPQVTYKMLLSYGDKRLRDAIFKRFGNIPTLPTPIGMTSDQQALWDEAVRLVDGDSAVEILAGLGTQFRSMRLRNSKSLTSTQLQLDRLKAEIGGSYSDVTAQIEDLKAQRGRAAVAEAQASALEQLASAQEYLHELKEKQTTFEDREAELQRLADNFDKIHADRLRESAEISAQIEKLSAEADTLRASLGRAEALRDVLQNMKDRNVTGCPLCSSGEVHAHDLQIAKFARMVTERQELHDTVADKVARLQQTLRTLRHEADVDRENLRVRRNSYDTDKARWEHAVEVAQRSVDALTKAAAEAVAYTGKTVNELDTEIRRLSAVGETAMMIRQNAEEVTRLETRGKALAGLAAESDKLVQSLITQVANDASAKISAHMPDGFSARISLDDDHCRLHIIDDRGVERAAKLAAGSEVSALMIGVILAWSADAEYRMLLIDDDDLAGFSPENVRTFLSGLAEKQKAGEIDQVFVAWSRPDEVPDVYNKIHTPL